MSDDRKKVIYVSPEVHERLAAEASARVVDIKLLVDRLLSDGLARLVPVDDVVLFLDEKGDPDDADPT